MEIFSPKKSQQKYPKIWIATKFPRNLYIFPRQENAKSTIGKFIETGARTELKHRQIWDISRVDHSLALK